MFGDYVFEKSSAQYTDKILLLDDENLNSRANYISAFSAHGFEIVRYTDDLTFRIEYEKKLKTSGEKMAIIAYTEQYIPYDVHRRLSAYMVSLEKLFPKLHTATLRNMDKAGLDLLCAVYPTNFDDLRQKHDTEMFLRMKVYASANVKSYLKKIAAGLIKRAKCVARYSDWFIIAEEKAQLDASPVSIFLTQERDVPKIFFQQIFPFY